MCIIARGIATCYVHDFTHGVGNAVELLHLKLIRKLLLLDDESRSLDRLRAANFETRFFFSFEKRTSTYLSQTMARFDINTRISLLTRRILSRIRFFIRFLSLRSRPRGSSSSQSDDGRNTISIRHRDYLSQLFTVPADVVLYYRWSLNRTSFPFFRRFVSLKLISATINHNDEIRAMNPGESTKFRVTVPSSSLSRLSLFLLFLLTALPFVRIFESNRSIDQWMRQIPLCFCFFFFIQTI